MPEYTVRAAVGTPGGAGAPTAFSPAAFSFTESDGFLYPDAGPPFQFDLAETTAVEPGDGTLRITVLSGEQVTLGGLGKMGDELISGFSRARNERTAYCFRFGRAIGDEWEQGEALLPGATAAGRAAFRLFFNLLGVLPEKGEPVAVPYTDVRRIAFDEAAYQVVVTRVDGAVFRFGKLAKRSTPFLEGLKNAVSDFSVAYQTQLKNVAPDVWPPALRQLSDEWREGVALPAARLDAVSPGFSARLLDFLPSEARKPFVAALRNAAGPPAIGFYFSPDAAAGGNDAPPFIPFALFPLKGGKALAWETMSDDALATYVFRGGDAAALASANAAWRSIRFAREPVYISEAELKTVAEYRHHVPLLLRSPELPALKQRYLGRALHTEPESYAASLASLAACA